MRPIPLDSIFSKLVVFAEHITSTACSFIETHPTVTGGCNLLSSMRACFSLDLQATVVISTTSSTSTPLYYDNTPYYDREHEYIGSNVNGHSNAISTASYKYETLQ